jgi:hypothetical protein
MLIVTVRQSDGLPSNVGAADGSKASVWRRLDAPNPDYIPVTGLSSKGIASTGAAPTGDCDGDTKSHAVNALFLRELPHGVEDYPVPANSVAASHLRAQCLDDMLTAIRDWSASTGRTRALWRRSARYEIARFRSWFLDPERAAFEAAIAASKLRRAA